MQKEIIHENGTIRYRLLGSGRPVMLVHGFGEDSKVWNPVIEHLNKIGEYQLIVPDLPGSGSSDLIGDMTMEGMAEALKKIIDVETGVIEAAGKAEITMIGHSMGGYITLAFAEKYGTLLQSFGLFHSTAYADSEEKIATRRKGISFIKENGAYEFLKTAIPNLFAPNSKLQIPNSIDELIEAGHNFSPEALVFYYESMIKRPDRTWVLKEARGPVLFVIGKHDNAIPYEDQLQQCNLPEKSYIHVLHESGHMGMLEETSKSNRLLEDFLSTA